MTEKEVHQELVNLKTSGNFDRFEKRARKILTNSCHVLRNEFYQRIEFDLIDSQNLLPQQKKRIKAIHDEKGEILAAQFFINHYLFNYDGLLYDFLETLIQSRNKDLVRELIHSEVPTRRRVSFEKEFKIKDLIDKDPKFKIRFFMETNAVELLPYIDIPAEAQTRVYTQQMNKGNFLGMKQLIDEVSMYCRLNRLFEALEASYSKFSPRFRELCCD